MATKIYLHVKFTEAQLKALFDAIDFAMDADPMMGEVKRRSLQLAREEIRKSWYDDEN